MHVCSSEFKACRPTVSVGGLDVEMVEKHNCRNNVGAVPPGHVSANQVFSELATLTEKQNCFRQISWDYWFTLPGNMFRSCIHASHGRGQFCQRKPGLTFCVSSCNFVIGSVNNPSSNVGEMTASNNFNCIRHVDSQTNLQIFIQATW